MYNIICGDALETLKGMESESVNCCVTSPPYYALRDYGVDGQIGLEKTPEEFIEKLAAVFHEVKRVLKDDGTLWVNIGDSYWGSGSRGCDFKEYFDANGAKQGTSGGTINLTALPKLAGNSGDIKNKDLIGIPWMLAFALRADGWYLRQDIIWAKTNPMPESVSDRCTKSHEYIFLLSKRGKYYYNAEAIAEPVAGSSTLRYMQNIEEQKGSDRVPGKTNGAMKAVLPKFGGNKYPDNNGGDHRKSGNEYEPTGLRNKRDVWHVSTGGFNGAHFATFSENLVKPCIMAGCPEGGTVLDPFSGSGTTGLCAVHNGRNYIGIELNPDYAEMSEKRLEEATAQASMFDPEYSAGVKE